MEATMRGQNRPNLVGCFLEDSRRLVMVIHKPCTFEQVLEILDSYQVPGVVTWDGNYLEGMVMVTVNYDEPEPRLAAIVETLNDEVEPKELPRLPALPPAEAQEVLNWGNAEENPEDAPEEIQEGGPGADEDPHNGADVVVLDDPTPTHEPGTSSQTPMLRRPYAEGSNNATSHGPPTNAPKGPQREDRRTIVVTEKGTSYYVPSRWNPYAIKIRVPYHCTYDDFVRHFSQFGPIDYAHFEESAPGPRGEKGYIGCVRYEKAMDAKKAYYGSPEWSPWRAYPTKVPHPKTTCPMCKHQITKKFRTQHTKVCTAIRRLEKQGPENSKDTKPSPLQERMTKQRQQQAAKPAPQSTARATEGQEGNSKKKRDAFIRPPSMARGPLVGIKIYKGYLQVFTHKLQTLSIRDEGQELEPPVYGALELQLRQVYGTSEVELP